MDSETTSEGAGNMSNLLGSYMASKFGPCRSYSLTTTATILTITAIPSIPSLFVINPQSAIRITHGLALASRGAGVIRQRLTAGTWWPLVVERIDGEDNLIEWVSVSGTAVVEVWIASSVDEWTATNV